MLTPSVLARFWAKVDRRGPDDCWLWRGCRTGNNGYGQFRIGKRRFYAHLVAFHIRHGRWPLEGMEGLHRCNIPPCVNPAHIQEGTHLANMRQAANSGRTRAPVGEAHHKVQRTGATTALVRELRTLRSQGYTLGQLTRYSGLTKANVWDIVRGRTWKHVEGDGS